MSKRTYTSSFAKLINEFLDFRSAQGYQITNHERYLRRFDSYCARVQLNEHNLTRETVHSWLDDEFNNGYVDLAGRSRAIRQFANYILAMGGEAYVISADYYDYNHSFVPYILSSKELSAFFSVADELEPWHLCDKFSLSVAPVVFRLMYTSGLRPSEARGLLDTDIDFATGEVTIKKNKRRKTRTIVVSDDMLRLLIEYKKQKEELFVRTSFLFPRIDGSAYTDLQLRELFSRCWKLANPNVNSDDLPRVRPYDLRHTFASSILQKWIDDGQDLFTMLPYLRSYMGHEHFSDTAYYIHILPDRIISSPGIDWSKIDSVVPEVSIWN